MENKTIGSYFVEMLDKKVSLNELKKILNEEVIKEAVKCTLK